MTYYNIKSTCDDAGNILAKRLEDSTYGRVICQCETIAQARANKADWLQWYASRNVPVGEGCLWIEREE